MMTAREYLQQARKIHESLSVLSQEIERRRTIAEKTVGQIQSERIQTSKTGKEGEDNLIAIAEMSKRLDRDHAKLNDLKTEIALNISRYAPDQAETLYEYYIKGMELEDIAKAHGEKSRQWAWSRKNAGEQAIGRAIVANPSDFSKIVFPCYTLRVDKM